MSCGSCSLYLLPLSVFFIFPATCLTTYIISIVLGHTEAEFPYISDTAAYSPESCIFAQCINLGALLILLTVYVRYRQLKKLYLHDSRQSLINRANKTALVFGCASALGMSLAANFQEVNVDAVHSAGAVLGFGGGTIYLWLQAVLSYRTDPVLNSLMVAHLRTGLALLATVFFIVASVCGVIASSRFDGIDLTKFYPGNSGWAYHAASAAAEWVVAACFSLFMLTLVGEFRGISIHAPQINVPQKSYFITYVYGSDSYGSVQSASVGPAARAGGWSPPVGDPSMVRG